MISRVLVCVAAIALVFRMAETPAAAATITAPMPGTASPQTDGAVGDLAPFSLETSGAGSDYTRSYIPNLPLRPSAPLQAPAQAPAQSPSIPGLPPP